MVVCGADWLLPGHHNHPGGTPCSPPRARPHIAPYPTVALPHPLARTLPRPGPALALAPTLGHRRSPSHQLGEDRPVNQLKIYTQCLSSLERS